MTEASAENTPVPESAADVVQEGAQDPPLEISSSPAVPPPPAAPPPAAAPPAPTSAPTLCPECRGGGRRGNQICSSCGGSGQPAGSSRPLNP